MKEICKTTATIPFIYILNSYNLAHITGYSCVKLFFPLQQSSNNGLYNGITLLFS
jgi:hypothetical protein